MRITLRELRRIVKEEVDRNMRWSAGIDGGGGINVSRNASSGPFPELGDETADEDEVEIGSGKEQKRPQLGLRILDREG